MTLRSGSIHATELDTPALVAELSRWAEALGGWLLVEGATEAALERLTAPPAGESEEGPAEEHPADPDRLATAWLVRAFSDQGELLARRTAWAEDGRWLARAVLLAEATLPQGSALGADGARRDEVELDGGTRSLPLAGKLTGERWWDGVSGRMIDYPVEKRGRRVHLVVQRVRHGEVELERWCRLEPPGEEDRLG